MQKLFWALLLIVVLVVVSCGVDDGKTTGGSGSTILTGTWKSSCVAETIVIVDASNSQVSISSTKYSDSGCKTAAYSEVYDFNYGIGNDLASPEGAKELDQTVTAATITILSDALVGAMNQSKYCGISDWSKDTPKDVTGKDCNGRSVVVGSTQYTSLLVQGTKLWLGSSRSGNDGKTTAKRMQVDTTYTYTKQ